MGFEFSNPKDDATVNRSVDFWTILTECKIVKLKPVREVKFSLKKFSSRSLSGFAYLLWFVLVERAPVSEVEYHVETRFNW